MSEKNIIIRPEMKDDYRAVESLTRESFWNVYQPGCMEHYVLHCYRNDPAFVPELDTSGRAMESSCSTIPWKKPGKWVQGRLPLPAILTFTVSLALFPPKPGACGMPTTRRRTIFSSKN